MILPLLNAMVLFAASYRFVTSGWELASWVCGRRQSGVELIHILHFGFALSLFASFVPPYEGASLLVAALFSIASVLETIRTVRKVNNNA